MEEVKKIENTAVEESDTLVQYIVVKIGNEQYGINIQYIDNIVRSQKITRVRHRCTIRELLTFVGRLFQ